jgi:hypothetical protein
MKKFFTLFLVVSIHFIVFAQAPQKMSYQCVVRDAGGVLVTNHSVGMRTSILQGTSTGTVVYQETYNPNPQTNANGLLSIEIGGGLPISGTFSSINWASGPYFLKTETDPSGGTSYTITGTSQLLSVPYALAAKTAETADYNDLTNKPLLPVPGGVSGNVQFNNAGVLGGDAVFTWDNSNKRLGIGTSTPDFPLEVTSSVLRSIYAETSYTTGAAIYGIANSASGSNAGVRGGTISTSGAGVIGDATAATGTTFGIRGIVNSASGYSGYFTGGRFYVQQNAGFGTSSPNATLDVNGTVQIGSSGKVFSEITEITGTTTASSSVNLAYPSGYTSTNTRVLSVEINHSGTMWATLGMYWGTETQTVGCILTSSTINVYYPAVSQYENRAIRVLIMKVQ